MSVPTTSVLAATLAVAALLLACGGKSGEQLSGELRPGLGKDEVMFLVADGAEIRIMAHVKAPPSGAWEEVVQNERALSVILAATVRTDGPISEIIWLQRGAGGLAADDFYLFFDETGTLLYHQRVRAR